MNVTEDSCPDFPGFFDAMQKFVGIAKADGIEPFAGHLQRWMMQANEDMFCVSAGDDFFESMQFRVFDVSARIVAHTTVYPDDKPVVA